MIEILVCHSCGQEAKFGGGVGVRDRCPHCDEYMHCCLNCNFYDPHMSNACREPSADWVPDKTKQNFCEFFEPNASRTPFSGKGQETQDPRKAFDDLFGKKS